MKRPLYGLQVEWSKPQSGYVSLTREESLTIRDLSELEEKMLRHNRIPRLLPIQFAEVDGSLTLQYRASGKRLLAKALRNDSVTPLACYRMLYAIASIIDDSSIFMLDENKYVLQEEFIFLGKEITDLHLMYIPIADIGGKGGLQEEFRRLTRRMFEHVQDFDGYRVNELLDYLKEETFGISALKRLLLEIVGQMEAEKEREPHHDQWQEPFSNSASSSGDSTGEVAGGLPLVPIREFKFGDLPAAQMNFLTKGRYRLFGVFALVGALAVWLWFAVQPSEAVLNVCFGTTLLSGAVCIVSVRRGRTELPAFQGKELKTESQAGCGGYASAPSLPEVEAEVERKQKYANGSDECSAKNTVNERMDIRHLSGVGLDIDKNAGSYHSADRDAGNLRRPESRIDDYYAGLSSRTTLLVPEKESEDLDMPDGTVFLGQSAMETTLLAPAAVLEVHTGDEHVFLPIASSSLIVGRKVASSVTPIADFELDAASISRQHLVFEQSGREYVVKDLASKNGSFLNGERLVPHREYALQDGDRIRMASVECVFKSYA
ncbi:DUF6382 domain-containing protein [Paenibacillus sp. MBLB4367]|uniref:DUF6382 domain-containing protein n=1 Tax=Paenibacillus sp. MBLB4367 TaxID=3384767 RepID=UPI003907F717